MRSSAVNAPALPPMRTFSLASLLALAVATSAQSQAVTSGPTNVPVSQTTSTTGAPHSSGLSAGAPGDYYGPGESFTLSTSTSTPAPGGGSSVTEPTPVSGTHSGTTQTIPPKDTGLPNPNNNEDPSPEPTGAAVRLHASLALVAAGIASLVF